MTLKIEDKLPFWSTCFDNKLLFETRAASQASTTFLAGNVGCWPGSVLADDPIYFSVLFLIEKYKT